MHTVNFSEARTGLKDLLDRVGEGEAVGIQRRTTVAAVLVRPDTYAELVRAASRAEALAEQVDDLEDLVAVLKHKIRPEPTVSNEVIREMIREELERAKDGAA